VTRCVNVQETYAVSLLVSYRLNSPAIQRGGRSFECRSATQKRLRNLFWLRALLTQRIFGKLAAILSHAGPMRSRPRFVPFGADACFALKSGVRADIPRPPLWAKCRLCRFQPRNKSIPQFATIATKGRLLRVNAEVSLPATICARPAPTHPV
jgi:hypothetical protein